ncbi:radical SAM protein [Candidatus Binatia bacterium]|nr:radical SAM protein [Candidatus Binatia bacterium]
MRKLSLATQEALQRVLGAALAARQRDDGRPFIVGHFITNRCMCSCASCLWRDNDCEDVPLADLQRFYAQARDAGFVAAALSGGEPFLRSDLGDVVRFMKREAGMSILLFTTGWYLRKRMDEVLPHIDMLIISLDSAKPERHDAIRGLPGLFDRAIEGVGMVKERYPDVSLQFNCCVQKGLVDEIDELLDLAARLDVQISFDVITDYRNGDGAPIVATEMGLPREELRALCSSLLEKKRAGAPILNSERYFDYFISGRPGYRCHMPKLVMFIDGRGNAEYCLDLTQPIANIRVTPLAEILEMPRFRQLRADAERCSSCNSPTMVDLSHVWENPAAAFEPGGIAVG